MGPQATLDLANNQRRERAAEVTTAAVADALARFGDVAPAKLVAAGNLRLAYPTLSLRELGEQATPPMTKYTIAARLRRLLDFAARATNV